MAKYQVPISFWGTIEADSAEEAFNKVYSAVDCDAFEEELANAGLTDVQHNHDEPEEDK
jgi:hypothetical protein